MSDFLGRLAQRSLGTMPGVETRPQLLFTPVPEPTPAVDAPAIAAKAGIPSQPRQTPPIISEHIQRETAIEQRMSPSARAAQPGHEMPRSEPRTLHEPLAPRTETHEWKTARPLEKPSPVTHDPRVSVEAAAPAMTATPVPLVDPDMTKGSAPRAAWQPLVATHEPPAVAAPPVPLSEVVAARAEPATPAIHISIGRVEVRAHIATAPQAVPKPRPQPRPGLSLEDYLKRGGGKP